MGHFFQMMVTPRIPNGMMLIPLPKYVVGWFTTFWNTPSTDKVWKALRITDDFFGKRILKALQLPLVKLVFNKPWGGVQKKMQFHPKTRGGRNPAPVVDGLSQFTIV